MNRPFFWVAVFFASGIGLQSVFPWELPTFLTLVPLTLSASLYLLKRTTAARVLFLLGVMSIGSALYGHKLKAVRTPDEFALRFTTASSSPVVLRGHVLDSPLYVFREGEAGTSQAGEGDAEQPEGEAIPWRVRFKLLTSAVEESDWRPTSGTCQMTWYMPDFVPKAGDVLEVKGRVRGATGFRNPELFDYGLYLNRQGVYSRVTVHGPGTVRRIGHQDLPFLRKALLTVRRKVSTVIAETSSQPNSGFLMAVLVGDRSQLSAELQDWLRRTGIYHVVSISGLHLGLIYLLLRLALDGLRIPEKVKSVLIIAAIVFYALFSGARTPVLRASLMVILFTIAPFFKRESDALNSLCIAAVIILALDPLTLFDAGFQLSFLAVLCIVTLAPGLRLVVIRPLEARRWRGNRRNTLTYAFAGTLAAQVGTWPIVAYYFNMFSLYSIVANLLLMPFMTMILALGFCTSIIGLVSIPVARLFATANWPFVTGFITLNQTVAALPRGFFRVCSPSLLFLALYYTALVTLAGRRQMARRAYRWAIGVNIILCALWIASWLYPQPREMEVVFLDVGRSDCAVIKFPAGETMLIDGGFRTRHTGFDYGERIIAPYLWRTGISEIDTLVLSHPHADHVGGLPFILRNFRVRQVVDAGQRYDSAPYREFLSIVNEKGIPYRKVRKGDEIHVGEKVKALVLNPPERLYRQTGADLNNNSVVIKVSYGNIDFLFMGDVEGDAKAGLLEDPDQLRCEILKAAHHGLHSTHANAFLDAVGPELVVLSTAEGGPPGAEISEAFSEYEGGTVLKTDRDGAVTVITDGQGFEWRTARQAQHRPWLN